MSPTEYYSVWSIYLASSLVLLGCFWWVTAFLKNETLKWLLRLPAIAITLMPAKTITPMHYSPALAAAAVDFIEYGWEGAQPHVNSLLLAIAFALLIVLIIHIKQIRQRAS